AKTWRIKEGRTEVPLNLDANGSVFVVFERTVHETEANEGPNRIETQTVQILDPHWTLSFDPEWGGPGESIEIDSLKSWSSFTDFGIRHYSGTARYTKTIQWKEAISQRIWLDLGSVHNLAEVTVNGKVCGIVWTHPYRVEITTALQKGENILEIGVTNTWANRLIGDHPLRKEERLTWTTAPYVLEGKPLLPAGLLGEVTIDSGK
ncbi:MAG TPA: hypothetical protein PLK12_03485, partial [Prolixibacteraceae bacterium]|nr:hypothetical protein [Prolixibacteraceae bacterium]